MSLGEPDLPKSDRGVGDESSAALLWRAAALLHLVNVGLSLWLRLVAQYVTPHIFGMYLLWGKGELPKWAATARATPKKQKTQSTLVHGYKKNLQDGESLDARCTSGWRECGAASGHWE